MEGFYISSSSSSSSSSYSGNHLRSMKPEKRKCSSKYCDRLSEMPDEVIVHILSYMPIVDAVRTMLIRRFGTLWTLIPTLKFEAEDAPDSTWRSNDVGWFYIFVRNVLMLHKRPVIDKFRLLLGWFHEKGRREAGDDIRMCLRFALDKQAKEIHFSDITSELTNSSDFPNFTSQSLVTLELCHCCIYPQLQVNLGSLKKLLFWHTEMSEEAFQQVISGCPSLEELHIMEPYDIKKLRFSAPNIRRLSLVLLNDEDTDDPWLFDFPNLISLDLELGQIPNVINVSSVRDVYLKQLLFNMDDVNELRRFNIFLEKFSCIEDFQLSLNASELLLYMTGKFSTVQWLLLRHVS
ncbi:F-box/LRR-repeat protein 25-like [Silene latifolia]|uniref:F-box/LRR-repeat protein 25-like n=1 Tax=Silene latifolia TaxID=37657 RepID=UPI003D7728BF